MDNKIIFDFLEKNLNLSGIKPEDTLKECLITSEAKKKNITIQEELQYQEKEYIKDTIFYPINLNFISLILEIEKKFHIIIYDFETEKINTINDLINIIKQKIKLL